MTKKSELWIAVGGDELTATVAVHQGSSESVMKIALAGTVTEKNKYVIDILRVAVESVHFDCAEIVADDMMFFDNGTVNHNAIECLLEVVVAVVVDGRKTSLSITNAEVQEVLENVMGSQSAFRHTVTILEKTPIWAPSYNNKATSNTGRTTQGTNARARNLAAYSAAPQRGASQTGAFSSLFNTRTSVGEPVNV